VYSESCENKEQALSREQQIKRWSRAKKEALINGDVKSLQTLARRKPELSTANSSNPTASQFCI
jgi:predicted GIY-YIG superfamily endonuclease